MTDLTFLIFFVYSCWSVDDVAVPCFDDCQKGLLSLPYSIVDKLSFILLEFISVICSQPELAFVVCKRLSS